MRSRPVQNGGRFNGKPFQRTQAEYVGRYGKSLPTIKRWWAKGYPLDDPDAMGEYLSPRGRNADAEIDDIPVPIVPIGDDDEPALGQIPIRLDETFLEGEGAIPAITRLKKAERERAAAYFAAICGGAPAQLLANRFKEWVGIIEALRKLAKDEPEIRKANDLTIDKTEVEAGIGQVFAAFRTAAKNLPGRAAAKLIGLRDRDEIYDVLEREMEVLLRALTELAVGAAAEAEDDQERPAVPEPIDDEAPEAEPPAPKQPRRKKRKAARK